MNHNEIILQLNNETLALLLHKEYEKHGQLYLLNIPFHKRLEIEKTFEYPIIKGEGQYMCTKGFIDLIVHCRSAEINEIPIYLNQSTIEFIIEIKTEKDFKDFGSILRQIKEYKEYYNANQIKKWESKISGESFEPRCFIYSTRFCVLSTTIPPTIKSIFENENILCLELDSLNQEKFD